MFGIKLRKIILVFTIILLASQLLKIISFMLSISLIIISGDIIPYVVLLLGYTIAMTVLPASGSLSKFSKLITSMKWIGGLYLAFLTVLVAMRFGSIIAIPAVLLLWLVKEDKIVPFVINGVHLKNTSVNDFYIYGQTENGIMITYNGKIQEIRAFALNGRQLAIPTLMQLEFYGNLVILYSQGKWYAILSGPAKYLDTDSIKLEQYSESIGISAQKIKDPLLILGLILFKSLNLVDEDVLAGIKPIVSDFPWAFLDTTSQIIPEDFIISNYSSENQRDKEIAHVDKMARLIAKSLDLSFRDFYELYIASDYPPPILNKKHKEVIDRYRSLVRAVSSYVLIGLNTKLTLEHRRENPILSMLFNKLNPEKILSIDEISKIIFTNSTESDFKDVTVIDDDLRVRQEV